MPEAFRAARDALAFLEAHRLAPVAENYTFALAVVADPGSDLARAVAAETDGGLRLTARALETLSERHLAIKRDTTAERDSAVTARANQLGALTTDAQTLTRSLSHDVSAMASEAENWPDATLLVTRLADAERELAELRRDVARLQSDLGSLGTARHDPMRDAATGALTSEGARPIFAQLAEQARSYVLMIFSVADLAGVNERFGHAVGDNVLSAFVANLRRVFPDEEIIRWTGNEFVVVVTDVALTAARDLADEAIAAFETRRLKLRGSGAWIGPVRALAGLVVGQGDDQDAALSQARADLHRAAVRALSPVEP
ncbi:diguanylate cyclase domain-containing protein [Sphingomonas sp. BK481]|jgi:diguanylate cyclase|uniref:GGDEF domain-containing protein n=1 Tax=Sphingomonas sp. BK481 TaxID=2586981 RepID=UPI00160B5C7B|nr:diguanylate cyclase [Sphingomonas sp. BK481]MBB3588094.1 diguanylate cyclase [Sphingomonas sp. BK481]